MSEVKLLSGDSFEEHILTRKQFNILAGRVDQMMSRVIGETLEYVEMLGLPPKQEEATKNKIKRGIWDTQNDYINAWSNFVEPSKCKNGCGPRSGCSDCPKDELSTIS